MTKIKICGIKTVTDALAAMNAGADLIGFNFYPKSPRYVEVGMCRNIMSVVRKDGRAQSVGVFVNASVAEILATMETLGLNLAQLHGDETIELLNQLDGKGFKAFRGIPESVDGFVRSEPPAFLGDWNEIVRLDKEAQKLELHPIDQLELMPFLQAYAFLGNQKQVKGISTRINTISSYKQLACNNLNGMEEYGFPLSPEMQRYADELFCK